MGNTDMEYYLFWTNLSFIKIFETWWVENLEDSK